MASAGMDEVQVGQVARFAKTVGETDVYLFAGLTGDLYQNHTNEEYMKTTRYGKIIAQGALLVGLMSMCSTKVLDHAVSDRPVVSYGYDRVRFVKPAFVGDTITVADEIVAEDVASGKTVATVTATNQDGDVVAVASHILKFL